MEAATLIIMNKEIYYHTLHGTSSEICLIYVLIVRFVLMRVFPGTVE